MNIPTITDKQKLIPPLLYKYRYLTVGHFLKLLNYKDPHRIKERLADLKQKGYIAVIEDEDITKPFIYCLDTKSKYLLQGNENCDPIELSRLHREKHRQKPFIDHHLFLANLYLFFDSVKEDDQTLSFFTKRMLKDYQHFPNPLPSAYIALKIGGNTRRYFLEVFDPLTPPFVLRNKVKYYLQYFRSGKWQAGTDSSPFPGIMFICPNTRLKDHVYMYSKSLFKKSFIDEFDLFLTTQDVIIQSVSTRSQAEIWKKVE